MLHGDITDHWTGRHKHQTHAILFMICLHFHYVCSAVTRSSRDHIWYTYVVYSIVVHSILDHKYTSHTRMSQKQINQWTWTPSRTTFGARQENRIWSATGHDTEHTHAMMHRTPPAANCLNEDIYARCREGIEKASIHT